ncbi:AAA family ATPase [Indivirus ILV1]|uniref:AAA family ATPase n=1 Tax=Indivirus ILV1 TaxID=1977633 RepID=A0A1V0SEI6_9VIRU|nr:AAA family ATPase [Indivirus ILV1]
MLTIESLFTGKFNINLVYYFILYQICQSIFAVLLQGLEYLKFWIEPIIIQKFYLDSKGNTQIYDILEYIYKTNQKRVNKDYTERSGKEKEFCDLIAPGIYVIMFNGIPVITNYSQETDKHGHMIRYLTMWTISFDKDFFLKFVKDSKKKMIKQRHLYIQCYETYVYAHKNEIYGVWFQLCQIPKRSLNDTILDTATYYNLTNLLDTFYTKPEYYNKYNIPYKLCILLSGPPGMGKTSIIKSIANKYDTNLYMISLNSINDKMLPFVFKSIKEKSILVFEDIDCMTIDRKINKKENKDDDDDVNKSVTLSGFLNALDGIVIPEGLVIIMTTNYPEKLDSALLRQERVHLHCKLEKSTEVYSKMFKRFFNDVSNDKLEIFANQCFNRQLNMADLQAHCINHLNNMEKALNLDKFDI